MSAARKESLHFKLDGGYLTDLVRRLWADEGEPRKALRILGSAFPEMTKSQQMSILSGEKKLVGDEHGMDLVDDGTTVSDCGNSLDPEAVFGKLMAKAKKEGDHLKDVLDLLNNDTVGFGSPDGLICVPRNRVEKGYGELGVAGRSHLKDGVDLDDVLHRGSGLRNSLLSLDRSGSMEAPPAPEIPEPSKPEPPRAQSKITSDTGWLTPDGKFYQCRYNEHIRTAESLGFKESQVEKMGWIKMGLMLGCDTHMEHLILEPVKPATQSQIDMIFDWCQECGKEMPYWATESV